MILVPRELMPPTPEWKSREGIVLSWDQYHPTWERLYDLITRENKVSKFGPFCIMYKGKPIVWWSDFDKYENAILLLWKIPNRYLRDGVEKRAYQFWDELLQVKLGVPSGVLMFPMVHLISGREDDVDGYVIQKLTPQMEEVIEHYLHNTRKAHHFFLKRLSEWDTYVTNCSYLSGWYFHTDLYCFYWRQPMLYTMVFVFIKIYILESYSWNYNDHVERIPLLMKYDLVYLKAFINFLYAEMEPKDTLEYESIRLMENIIRVEYKVKKMVYLAFHSNTSIPMYGLYIWAKRKLRDIDELLNKLQKAIVSVIPFTILLFFAFNMESELANNVVGWYIGGRILLGLLPIWIVHMWQAVATGMPWDDKLRNFTYIPFVVIWNLTIIGGIYTLMTQYYPNYVFLSIMISTTLRTLITDTIFNLIFTTLYYPVFNIIRVYVLKQYPRKGKIAVLYGLLKKRAQARSRGLLKQTIMDIRDWIKVKRRKELPEIKLF
jgi:hypothetical protein